MEIWTPTATSPFPKKNFKLLSKKWVEDEEEKATKKVPAKDKAEGKAREKGKVPVRARGKVDSEAKEEWIRR